MINRRRMILGAAGSVALTASGVASRTFAYLQGNPWNLMKTCERHPVAEVHLAEGEPSRVAA